MEHSELLKFANIFIRNHPEHERDVLDLVQLCKDEIEEGGSPDHERELCIESIKQLLEDE